MTEYFCCFLIYLEFEDKQEGKSKREDNDKYKDCTLFSDFFYTRKLKW